MKHLIVRQVAQLAVIVALVGPTLAQTEDGYDTFGVVDDNIPLDQLAPFDDTLPPPQTFLSDDPGVVTEGAAAVPPQATVAQDAKPAVPQIARFTPPADWTRHEIKGITLSTPAAWVVTKRRDDELVLFGGDMETHAGPSFMVRFDRKSLLEQDEMDLVSKNEHLLADGGLYTRVVVHGEMAGGKVVLDAVGFETPETNGDDDYLSFMAATFNDDYSAYKELFDQILGTVVVSTAAPKARPEAFDGLVSYVVPKGWVVHSSADGEYVALRTKYYAGYIAIAIADRVAAKQGMDDEVPAKASTPQAAQIFGQDAILQTWQGPTEFYVGASVVAGQYSYYRLNKCLPNDVPIGIVLAGAPAFFQGDDFEQALAGITFSMPEGMKECGLPSSASPTVPPEPTKQQEPAVGAQASVPQQNTTQTVATGQTLNVQGVQFTLPQNWTAINDSPSDKIFTSPDGRFTVLAFWWFPDEPITNYDDISVKQVVNDHEPSTRITSKIGALTTILNVTERARADETRFIFTVEGSNVPLDELRALHDALIPTLRFNNVFNPEVAREAVLEPADPAPAPVDPKPQSTATWTSYENTRFGTRVSYPSNLFRELEAPSNNDGRSFKGIRGSHSFLVFGQHNVQSLGIQGLIDQDKSLGGYDTVTYEKTGDGWYVLSGFKGRDISYRKVILDTQNEVFHVLEITYPKALKKQFGSVVIDMAASFEVATDASQTPLGLTSKGKSP